MDNALGAVTEKLYLGPGINSKEELDAMIEATVAPDASRTQWIADCPRRAQHALIQGIFPEDEAIPLRAGKALHAAMATFYTVGDEDAVLSALRTEWGYDEGWRLPPGHRYAHLHLGHLEVIVKNYFNFAKRHDHFRAIALKWEDLNLENVLGGIFHVTEAGLVVLGESKVVMRFTINGEPFIYSGIPDLPVEMGGAYFVFDHKSTNAYLSDYYFEQYKFSNQLRCYCLMVQELTGLQMSGTLINGIYMGDKASSTETKANKFARYGPMMYAPGQLAEGILNQYYWRKTLDYHKSQGYFPQHSSKMCGSCNYRDLCNVSPSVREAIIARNYTKIEKKFLEI